MVKTLLLSAAVLVFTACAVAPKTTTNATKKQMHVTGSHIPRDGDHNLEAKSISPMRVYGERDLESTGRPETGAQIDRLDPSATSKVSSGAQPPK